MAGQASQRPGMNQASRVVKVRRKLWVAAVFFWGSLFGLLGGIYVNLIRNEYQPSSNSGSHTREACF